MNQVFARVPFFILPSTVIDMIRWNSAVFTRFLFCRCPRRIPLLIFFVIGGTACITAGVIPFIWKTSNCKYSCPVCVVHVHSEEGGGGIELRCKLNLWPLTRSFSSTVADRQRVITGCAIVGKFGASGVFSLTFLYTSELYPTVIR